MNKHLPQVHGCFSHLIQICREGSDVAPCWAGFWFQAIAIHTRIFSHTWNPSDPRITMPVNRASLLSTFFHWIKPLCLVWSRLKLTFPCSALYPRVQQLEHGTSSLNLLSSQPCWLTLINQWKIKLKQPNLASLLPKIHPSAHKQICLWERERLPNSAPRSGEKISTFKLHQMLMRPRVFVSLNDGAQAICGRWCVQLLIVSAHWGHLKWTTAFPPFSSPLPSLHRLQERSSARIFS